jgi:hypothetical protein
VDPAFPLPLPDLATRGIDHRPSETFGDGAVISQATAICAPVPVRDDRLLIIVIVVDLNEPAWV